MDAGMWIELIVKVIVLIAALLVGFAYLTYTERKLLARFQNRYGPNRAGPFGLLQPMADGLKLIFKEELIPEQADKLIFILAPILTVVPAWIVLAVIPLGSIDLFGRTINLSLAGDLNVGILYIMAVTSISVYGIVLAGWSSNNKYAMLGGIRSSAQMISYELALGLAFVGPVMMASSLSLARIVEAQSQLMWFAVLQPIGFLIFLVAALAEINRAPFDMPEAEQELTAGYHVEYSGMKFAMFMLTEYTKMIVVSVIAATLYLGGFHMPFITDRWPWMGPFMLLAKVFVLLFVIIWLRATLPRVRYDQLMQLGWKILLPIAFLNVCVTAGVMYLLGMIA
ncbi:MAG: NADH-quinone oxidoreductase subunit NuoH [Anaerolineales bacterium]|nr:NADH-quinone oxidoreductase subunit NuoH [Anaerolineales bacterium]